MYQRKQRGATQKLFLVETLEQKNDNERQYVIMGSTGNVYTVTISCTPTCTCPDYKTRYNRCKHIFFVLLRIMKVKDPDKNKYTDIEIKNMFDNIPEITNALCVNNSIKDKYIQVKEGGKGQIRDDDVCPICLDDIKSENNEPFDSCNICRKCVHTDCFNMWKKKNTSVCLFCRN